MMAVNASSNGYVHATQATYEKSIWSLWRRHYVVGIWHGEASEPLLWVRDHGVTMNLSGGPCLCHPEVKSLAPYRKTGGNV